LTIAQKSDIFWTITQYGDVVSDFLSESEEDAELLAAVTAAIQELSEKGNKCGLPTSRHLEDGIFELRAKSKRRQARLLYFFEPGARIVIAYCFFKKKRATGKDPIDIAKDRRKELAKS
jgi:phage-related protein